MSKIEKITFVTFGYPTPLTPHAYSFVHQLVCAIADLGIKCTVICPVSISRNIGKKIPPAQWQTRTSQGNVIDVYSPRYLSYSNWKFWKINTNTMTFWSFKNAVDRAIKIKQIKQDALYAHFMFPSGVTVAELGVKYELPVFCAVGEGTDWTIKPLGSQKTSELLKQKVNLFAVSTSVKKMLAKNGIGREDQIPVFPNGVDLELFQPLNKCLMRKKYGFPVDAFILCFVGKFSYEKGLDRIVEAINGLDGVYGIFIGQGECATDIKTTLYKGSLPHGEIPLMLNASDIFVLPTLIEGSSNAIVEALACGLPVISSKYDFNDEILDDACSIRIDPLNIQEIRDAICQLKQYPVKRQAMGFAAIRKAADLDIRKRAAKILSWMKVVTNTIERV